MGFTVAEAALLVSSSVVVDSPVLALDVQRGVAFA